MFAATRYPRSPVIDPWRLVRVAVDADPSADEYGLLDPRPAEEPDLQREGLLSQAVQPATPMPEDELPIPGTKPTPPGEGVHPYKMVPGPLRSHTLPIPPTLKHAYRKDWHPFHHALRRSGMPSEMEIDFARNIFGYEGGMEINSDNGATAGITRSTLADMGGGQGSLPAEPAQLSVEQVAQLYKRYFDDAFDDVHVTDRPLPSIRDRKAAGQIIDVLFHWKYDGGRKIQEAINDIVARLPDSAQHQLGLHAVGIDGDIGDVTYTVFNRLLAAGFGPELRNSVADRVVALAKAQYGHVPKYLKERIDQFR